MMTNRDDLEYLELLESLETAVKTRQIDFMFPDDGPYRRELYSKHTQFMKAGAHQSQRLLSGGNRTGKTKTGATEMAYHLTGDYPSWWEGRKFLNPIKAWAAGVTNQSTKEIIQEELLGPYDDMGSGLIPGDSILKVTKKPGVAGAVETVLVKHKSGGVSELTFKSYDQKRDNFQGTKRQVIWLDEEPRDAGIYEECVMRTADAVNPGIIYMTFTPLFGLSKIVESFLEGGKFPEDNIHPNNPDKFAIAIEWADVPHLSEADKTRLLSAISPHLREARTRGLPNLGSGVIYPYPEDEITVAPFAIPDYWPKGYGMDVGWNRTAVCWLALDPDSRTIYIYSEHYEGAAPPVVHAHAIKDRGDWIPGVIDPGSRATSQVDGRCLFNEYSNEGLLLEFADNAINAGILKVSQAFMTGQLKIFSTCRNLLKEFRLYRRDENGKIDAKQDDHLMDAMRYAIMACPNLLALPPDPFADVSNKADYGRDDMTGY